MFIKQVRLKNFRCFTDHQFDLDGQFIVIKGENGAGKTSLLEALHYSCYLRSFKTHLSKDLVSLDKNHFFIQVEYDLNRTGFQDQVQIGYSEHEGKVVKFNQKPIVSYKDLISQYCLVTMTADDIQLIDGAPTYRRDFLNYFSLLAEPDLLHTFKRYKQIQDQRTSLLQTSSSAASTSFQDQLYLWTKQLWEESHVVYKLRLNLLQALETTANSFFTSYIYQEHPIKLLYSPKNEVFYEAESFDEFWRYYQNKKLLQQELKFKRNLIGCHLDDFDVVYYAKKARVFSSRGQQKLLTFLLKVAQFKHLQTNGRKEVLLLDDFLTDFDEDKAQKCLKMLLSFDLQIIVTVPTQKASLFLDTLPNNYFQIEI